MSNPVWDDRGVVGTMSEHGKTAAVAAADALSDAAQQTGQVAGRVKDTAGAAVSTLKEQAAQAADEAKTTLSAVAEEAKVRLAQIVDDQKSAGADHVAGMARAAYAAAGDLRKSSPQLANFVTSAAEKVDHIADDIRGSSLADILVSLSDFGRRRPVAFFGGAVAAGFLLARFVKSDAPSVAERTRDARRA